MNAERQGKLEGYEYAIEDANNKTFIIEDMMGIFPNDDSVISKIRREIAEETIDEVVGYMRRQFEDMRDAFEMEEFISKEK